MACCGGSRSASLAGRFVAQVGVGTPKLLYCGFYYFTKKALPKCNGVGPMAVAAHAHTVQRTSGWQTVAKASKQQKCTLRTKSVRKN